MTKTQTALLLACFGGDQSELIREIDSHWREVNQEKRGGDGGDKRRLAVSSLMEYQNLKCQKNKRRGQDETKRVGHSVRGGCKGDWASFMGRPKE